MIDGSGPCGDRRKAQGTSNVIAAPELTQL